MIHPLPNCDVSGKTTIECTETIDCVFLAWSLEGDGYWSCEYDPGEGKNMCVPVDDATYCGGSMYGYCSEREGESEQSCIKDCPDESCKQVTDCIYNTWPLPPDSLDAGP
ncbi:MAG: hypothetical protein GY854_04800 [Deltaproteobacteria bacterium]|nr:hypothetical protein [Deltaproteobacteria bacterium]